MNQHSHHQAMQFYESIKHNLGGEVNSGWLIRLYEKLVKYCGCKYISDATWTKSAIVTELREH